MSTELLSIASNMSENDALLNIQQSIVKGAISVAARKAGRKQMFFIPLKDESGKRDTKIELFATIEVMPSKSDGSQFLTVGAGYVPQYTHISNVTPTTPLVYKITINAYVDSSTHLVVDRSGVVRVNFGTFFTVVTEDGLAFTKQSKDTGAWENYTIPSKLSKWGVSLTAIAAMLSQKINAFMNDWQANPNSKFVDLRKQVNPANKQGIVTARNPLAFSLYSEEIRAKLLQAGAKNTEQPF